MGGAGAYHAPVPISAALRLWAPVVLWAAVIFAFSSVSDLGTGLGTWDLVLRKLAHAAEFAVLGGLLLRALRDERAALAPGSRTRSRTSCTSTSCPAASARRSTSLIDSVGVAVGVLLWRRFGR